jgi:uncharacterized protein (TIGR02246 family)
MSWTRGRVTLAVFLLASLPVAISRAQEQSTVSADSAGIKRAVADFTDAFNHHDPHSTAASFTEEADLTNTRGMSNHGRKEIEEHYGSLFAGFLKNAHRTVTVRNVRFLTPDQALVDSDWEMTGSKAPDGSNMDVPLRKGLLDWVMTKENGRWLITIYHESDFPSTPAR